MNIKIRKICLLFLLFTTGLQAQIQKLSALSKNEILDSKIIYDDNGEDVWGYFLLSKVDKVSKEFMELEFIILDKNLNKIGSNTFQQDYYDSWLVDILPNIRCLIKNNNELVFAIGYDYDQDLEPYAFRRINLQDFSIGNTLMCFDDKFIEDNDVMNRLIKEKKEPSYFIPIKNSGFLTLKSKQSRAEQLVSVENGALNKIKRKQIGYAYYDLDFNKKWDYNYEVIEDGFESHKFLTASNNILIFFKEYGDKAFKKKDKFYYKIVEQNTGTEISTIPLFDANYTYSTSKIIFENDSIIFYDKIHEYTTDGVSEYGSLGISKRVFSIKTKAIVEQKNIFWDAMSKHIDVSKYGCIGKTDFIHFLDIKNTSDGKTVMVGEGYSPDYKRTDTKNLYAIVLNVAFELESFKEIPKSKNTIDFFLIGGDILEKNHLFDFMHSQKIKEDEYVYYYQDEEKVKGPDVWVLGILTYVDGQFDTQKITLTTKSGKIIPIKAKSGYVLLQELTNDDKDSEIRLEKINY